MGFLRNVFSRFERKGPSPSAEPRPEPRVLEARQFVSTAEEQRREGRLDAAIETLERGTRENPTYVAAFVSLGRMYQGAERVDDAIRALETALTLDRENLVAVRLLGDLYLRKGDKVEAIKRLKRFRGLKPGDRDVEELIRSLDAELNPRPASLRFVPPAASPSPAAPAPAAMPAGSGGPSPVALGNAAVPPRAVDDSPTVALFPRALVESPASIPEPPPTASAPLVIDVPPAEAEAPPSVAEAEPEPEAVPPPAPMASLPADGATLPATRLSGLGVVSETLADLYRSQGHLAEAQRILETLEVVEEDPDRRRHFRGKIEALRAPEGALGARERLEDWSARFPDRPAAAVDDMGEVLRRVARGAAGVKAIALTDAQGLPVVAEGRAAGSSEMETLIAELTGFWKGVQRAERETGVGALESISIHGNTGAAVMAAVSNEYALVLQLTPGASIGRVRYEASRAARQLKPALL